MKIIRSFFYLLSTLFILLIAVLIYCGNSQQCSAWIVDKLSQKSSGKFVYTHFSGSLLHDFSMDGILLHYERQNISIANFHFAWMPIELLRLHLKVNQMGLNDVQWNDFSEDQGKTHFSHQPLDLPWWLSEFNLQDLQIHRFYFHQKKTRLSFKDLQAQAFINKRPGQINFSVSRLESSLLIFSDQKISLQGSLSGNFKNYHWELNIQPVKSPSIKFLGTGTDSEISLTNIQSVKWPTTLNTMLRFQWSPFLSVESSLKGTLDPKIWATTAKGCLSVDTNFEGKHLDDSAYQWRLNLNQLNGKVNGRNIKGSGTITDKDGRLIWKDWRIQVADSLMEIAGELSQRSHLAWNISIHNLGYWVPKTAGQVYSKGVLDGDFASPNLSSTANVNHLKFWELSIQNLDFAANIHAKEKIFFLNLQGDQWRWKDNQLNRLNLQTTGTLSRHEIDLALFNEIGKVTARLQGSLHDETWNGILQSLSIIPQNNLPWRIKAPVSLSVSQDDFLMHSPLCVLQNKDSICTTFSRHQEDKKFSLQTSQISLGFLQNFFSNKMTNLRAKLNATIEIQGSAESPTKFYAQASLTQGEGYLLPYNLNLKNIWIKLEGWSQDTLNLTGSVNSGDGVLNANGKIENLFSNPVLKIQLKGTHVLLSDLPSYQVWASPSLDFLLSSTQLGLTGDLFIPEANLRFVDYQNKVVTLTDDVVYADESQHPFNFASNISLILGNKVYLRYGGLSGNLSGKLALNQTGNAPATASGAIHLLGGEYKAYGQILTIQKGEASYKGGDVDDPILDVQAIKVLQNVTPLTSDGAVLSTGGWVSPDGNLTVGVSITGPLSARRTELFSIPAGLSQSDILSYLILGVPSSQAGSGGGQLLLSAASSLGGDQEGGPISELQNQLKNTLGIEVGVGTVSQYNPTTQSTAQGTALILTKSLSPKLFFTYSAGTGQTVSVFKVRYQMTPKWSAQTESSALGNGGDVYYTISRE